MREVLLEYYKSQSDTKPTFFLNAISQEISFPNLNPSSTSSSSSFFLFFISTAFFGSLVVETKKMLGKKIGSMKKLARRAKVMGLIIGHHDHNQPSQYEYLLRENDINNSNESGGGLCCSPSTTPTGTFAVYVGDERQRFVVPTGYLSHPLFKMLLDKAYNEFGFEQKSGLVVPCSVAAFQEVVSAVECCNGKFHFGDLVEEFLWLLDRTLIKINGLETIYFY